MAVKIGILNDTPFGVANEVFEHAATLGFAAVQEMSIGARLPEVELVAVSAEAHPVGSSDAAVGALRELAGRGVIAVIGPAISDNALACLPVADELRIPCINWSGSERTRSEWMFHYQVGSLEDEPYVIAEHMAQRGWRRVAVVREDSIIGRDYARFFDDAAIVHGLEIVTTIDLDVQGTTGSAAATAVDRAAPDAVAYFGFPSVAGFAHAMSGRSLPVVADSALMIGHADPDLAIAVDGWNYIDVFDEDNVERQQFLALWPDPPSFLLSPLFDMARLIALGLVHAPNPDSNGVRLGLERVKRIPVAIGEPGTIAGFGQWKRSALEGGYLVLRRWIDGQSIRVNA